MKKGILVAILALLTGVTLVGCGQKAEEQTNNDSDNNVSTTENQDSQEQDSQEQEAQEDSEASENGETENTEQNENSEEGKGEPMDLGEQTVEGETIEGNIFNGKYRLTNGPDRVVMEWSEELFKEKKEYVFTNDKLSAINVEHTFNSEEQAKAEYDTVRKKNEEVKKVKDLRLEGATIKFTLEESEWEDNKNYTKQQFFDEQKKMLEQYSQVDDVRSDD